MDAGCTSTLNGLYWGMYHVHERPDGDFMASYFGGESEDYDTVSAGSGPQWQPGGLE